MVTQCWHPVNELNTVQISPKKRHQNCQLFSMAFKYVRCFCLAVDCRHINVLSCFIGRDSLCQYIRKCCMLFKRVSIKYQIEGSSVLYKYKINIQSNLYLAALLYFATIFFSLYFCLRFKRVSVQIENGCVHYGFRVSFYLQLTRGYSIWNTNFITNTYAYPFAFFFLFKDW